MTDKEIIELIERKLEHLSSIPIGAIFAFPSDKIPENYLPCEGQELSRVQFSELFELIGTSFGGDANTFCLPDLQGQFIRGLDRDGNVDIESSGDLRKIGSFQQDAIVGHGHQFNPASISTAKDGDHSHCVYLEEFTIRDASSFDSNNHKNWYFIPSDQYYRYGWCKYDIKTGTGSSAAHSHSVIVKDGTTPIGNPVATSYGMLNERIASETRAKNMALIFCIKVK